jgi:CBS domain-containing protein
MAFMQPLETAMRVSDIMTTRVVTVAPDTGVTQIANRLVQCRISAVPVLECDRVVGIVSEGDLMHRHEIGTDDLLEGADEYVRSHGLRAADLMTSPVVSVTEDTVLARAARLMAKHRIKRVLVLRRGRLVGVVSRSDLVRALATASEMRAESDAPSDEDLRRRLLQELLPRPWWHACSSASVRDGIAELWGVYEYVGSREAARVAAQTVPGLRGLEDHRIALASLPRMM